MRAVSLLFKIFLLCVCVYLVGYIMGSRHEREQAQMEHLNNE